MGNDSAGVRERHKSLYFMDGNVAILAPRKDGQSDVLFRVHKSVLSGHSPVFSDMFDVCDPSGSTTEGDAGLSYDGVPLVRLADDADHLGSVLEIIYYHRKFPCMPRSPDYPVLVGPILELARKYGIDRMYAQIVEYLESDWPKTLKDWDKVERETKILVDYSVVEHIDDHSPEPAAAIQLARQFDLHSVLPAAFYHLSRLSILDDWEKTHAGTRSPTKRTARWELLSAEDLRCLLLGRAELAGFLRECVDPKDFCHTDSHTGRRMTVACNIGEEVWKDVMNRCLLAADPLALLQTEAVNVRSCTTCATALRDKIQAVRAQIWEKLGELFHLEVQ